MRKITFLSFLLLGFLGYSQTLPIDFELPEDDAWGPFNGATAMVVTDPTDPTNNVLELTSNGNDFDGAALNMATYIDLSDDANNTVTLRFWTPDATTRTHLFKVEGATNGPPAAELFFDTTAAGWQTITLDFGAGLADDYAIMVLFADSGSGNTATGTYYIDDIDGPNGDPITPDPIPSEAAPVPDFADSEVYSIYNDSNSYTNNFPVAYDFGTSSEVDLGSGVVNNARKFNFGVAGWGQGEGGPDDVSAYSFFTFYYWAGPSGGASGWNIELIDNVGGTVTGHIYQYTAPQETIVEGAWQAVSVPLTVFAGFDPSNFFQWKLDPLGGDVNNAQIVYIDNVFFTTGDILNTNEFDLDEFAVFPNPAKDLWNISSSNNQNLTAVRVYDMLGKEVISIEPNATDVTLNAADLRSGIYLARVSTANGSKTIKLVKN